jgi:hypothetical protein
VSPSLEKSLKADDQSSASIEAFCKRIGYADARYLHIEELFVQPRQYEEIRRILDEHHIVCITGDPFVGKTYTAVHLLYQLFVDGYSVEKPKERELSAVVTDLVRNPEVRLAGKKAFYVEDPFGRESFIRLQPLVTEFVNLVYTVKETDARIIVTSRSELFERGLGTIARSDLVDSIRVQLQSGVAEPSRAAYSRSDLAEVFDRYVRFRQPRWADHAELHSQVRDIALNELNTPQSLEFFVSHHTSELNLTRLARAISDCRSENIVRAFALEIAQAPMTEIAFLLLVDGVHEDVMTMRHLYESRILPAFLRAVEEDPLIMVRLWEQCVGEYQGKLTEYTYAGHRFWSFYHPFLVEAISVAIGEFPVVEGVLGQMFQILLEEKNPFLQVNVAEALLRRASAISRVQLRLLDQLTKHEHYLVRAGVWAAIVKYLADVPKDLRPMFEEWLGRSVHDEDAWVCRNIAIAIARDYEVVARTSPKVARIFDELSHHPDPNVRYGVAEAVLWYYSDVHRLHPYLWRQAEDPDPLARGLFVDAIIWQFPVLTEEDQKRAVEIIYKYATADSEMVRGWLKAALTWHYESLLDLPRETYEEIFSLVQEDTAELLEAAADSLEWHYNYFEKYKPQFIGTMTSSAIRPTEYSGIMQTMFWGAEPVSLAKHVEAFFVKLATAASPRVRGWASFAFCVRYLDLSPENRLILNALVDDPSTETRGIVVHCIAANYSRAESLMRPFLEKLAGDPVPTVRAQVLDAISTLGSEVPLEVRQHIRDLAVE